MKEPIYLDLYQIKKLSLNLINCKNIIKEKYNIIKYIIREKYEYLKFSYKYSNLLKKVVKENNLQINRFSNSFNDIILNNNLQNKITDLGKIISVTDAYIHHPTKIQGMDVNTICKTLYEEPTEFQNAFLVKRYTHDKGYRYLRYLKFYNLDGVYFELDLYSINNKITEIIDIYYKEDFGSIVIVGKKLTYGENIENNYIIKVFTLFHKLKNWHKFIEIENKSYINDLESYIYVQNTYENNVKMFLNSFAKSKLNLVCIDTIDITTLKLFEGIKDLDISIGTNGIDIIEKDKEFVPKEFVPILNPFSQEHRRYIENYSSCKKHIRIRYNHDERCIEDLTRFISEVRDKTYILHTMDGNPHLISSHIYDSCTNHNETLKEEIEILSKKVNDLEEEIIMTFDPKIRLSKKVEELIEKAKKRILLELNLFNKRDVDLKPIEISDKNNTEKKINDNYNKVYIPFDSNYVKKKK